jgi:hypothetical protein
MKRFLMFGLAAALASAGSLIAQHNGEVEAQPQASGASADAGFETLTRGPVHEAFAEPVALNVSASVTAPQEPPEAIEEIPPETKPEGNAEWMPGYWSWDDERDDYIWVSGVWRVAPHGQRWVPGYWTQASDGWRRVSGFWTSIETNEVAYLAEPPESQENGPTSEPPSAEHFWVPGCWIYRDARYAWRPGYWSQSYDNWLWVPHHYVWTPRGVVFVNGYWDAPLDRRGMLFAPVHFHRPIYRTAGFRYVPEVVVNIGGLHLHLFARPRYHHYYFGDYYADRYTSAGFYPWFAYQSWGGYDPFYQYSWTRHGRHRRDWVESIHERHRWYRENERERPAHTFAEYRQQVRRGSDGDRTEAQLAMTLSDAARGDLGNAARRLTRLAENERSEIARDVRRQSELVQERRSRLERGERVTLKPSDDNAAREANRPVLELPDVRDGRTARRDSDARRNGRPGAIRPDTIRPDTIRPDATPGTQRPDRPARRDRPEPTPDARRPDRPDQPGRPDRPNPDRPTRPDRPDATGEARRPGSPDRTPRSERPNGAERPERPARSETPDRPNRRPTTTETPRSARPDGAARPDRAQPAQRPDVRRERSGEAARPRANRPAGQPRAERPRSPQTNARPQPTRQAQRPQPQREPRAERPRVERPRAERPPQRQAPQRSERGSSRPPGREKR